MQLKSVKVKNFRKFKNIDFSLGKRITAFSGVNGIGKSSLVSLIASTSGTRNKRLNNSTFQPEFTDYFHILPSESFRKYKVYVDSNKFFESKKGKYCFTKRISFKDDRKTGRGIRTIPRTSVPLNNDHHFKNQEVKKISHSDSGRFPIPTIYLSLTRLMPPAESSLKEREVTQYSKEKSQKAFKYFCDCYNRVLFDSIDSNFKNPKIVEKHVGNKEKEHLTLKVQNTTNQTVSAGQDTLGAIVSALTDFYILKNDNPNQYSGGILCIDEIDASLHPSAVVKLIRLLVQQSEKLDLQILFTTHSLIVLKEISKLQYQKSDDYKLIYFVNYKNPSLMNYPTYNKIRADLYDQISERLPKIDAFCEDEAGKRLFSVLWDLFKIKNSSESLINQDLNICSMHLGGEQLIKLPEISSIFRKVLILPDGDQSNKESPLKKYSDKVKLYKVFKDFEIDTGSKINVPDNIVFLPGRFSPEIFLFYLLNEYIKEYTKHTKFWDSIETFNELMFPVRVKEHLKINENTTYADIHDNKEWLNIVFDFMKKSHFLDDYSRHGKKKEIFDNFFKKLDKALKKVNEVKKRSFF